MSRIFIKGDIHGNRYDVIYTIAQIDNPTEDDKIIVCGDAGLSYDTWTGTAAKKEMKKFPGYWIIMRGNHDDRYWAKNCQIKYENGEPIEWIPHDGWEITLDGLYLYQKKYPNILYVYDDGGLYNIDDYNFLFVPGAYSVDKYYRLENHLAYNPDEQLTVKEQNRLIDLVKECNIQRIPVDFVIGHTFPLHIEPYYRDLFLAFIDQSSVDKNMEKFLDVLSKDFEQNFAFKHYFGGHFHDDRELNSKYTMLYYDIANIESYI